MLVCAYLHFGYLRVLIYCQQLINMLMEKNYGIRYYLRSCRYAPKKYNSCFTIKDVR
jgi:hypothetical protein